MTVLHVLVYFSLLVFLAGVIARVLRIARMPVHLRWELYPVPHEKGRAGYGGSALEEVDWWTKPRQLDRLGELGVMLSEIFLLKALWEHNRRLWFGSFTLHYGLYLLIAELALFTLTCLLTLAGVAGNLIGLIGSVAKVLAWIGCTVGLIGAVLMLYKRVRDPKLRPYSNASHFFNLMLLGAMFLTGLLWVATDPTYADRIVGFFVGWMSVSELPALPPIGYWHLGFLLFFLVYFPFTHMTHAFVKYFTYHDIRWEDEPNRPGGKMQAEIEKLENQVVTWAAPHVNADGRKTWLDVVSESAEEKKEK